MAWLKLFTNSISDKKLIFKIHKKIIQPNSKNLKTNKNKHTKPNNLTKEQEEGLNGNFSEEEMQIAKRSMTTYSTSLIIREM